MNTNEQLKPLVVVNIVGLTPSLLGENTPHLNAFANDGFMSAIEPLFPALTMPVQASILSGVKPGEHGVVANGWHYRELAETRFWHQSDYLVQAKKVWDYGKEQIPGFTSAKLFWQSNMYSDADYSVTLRPVYPADGRKIPMLYSAPGDLHQQVEDEIGPFPYFNYWGPAAGVASSEWIAACAKWVFDKHRPTLSLVYLPHLDYNLQRLGPSDAKISEDVRTIDAIAGKLIDYVRERSADVMVISEYGIEDVDNCVHINRLLRREGLLAVRHELGLEMLDAGASRAFAVADHQVAHVYVRHADDVPAVQKLLAATDGIANVLTKDDQREFGIDHERSGELVAVADRGSWFSYYYWLDDRVAPDFARTVDIHRKPGYDPVELFIDPQLRMPKVRIVRRLVQKTLGFRTLMDVIPLDAGLVKGSHGRLPDREDEHPVLMSNRTDLRRTDYKMTDLGAVMLDHWR